MIMFEFDESISSSVEFGSLQSECESDTISERDSDVNEKFSDIEIKGFISNAVTINSTNRRNYFSHKIKTEIEKSSSRGFLSIVDAIQQKK
jgi:hypothetical protein